MRILFATAELAPVAIVGGLGSASSGLVRELRAQGHDVEAILPDYGDVVLADEVRSSLATPDWTGPMTVRRGVHAAAGSLTLIGSAAIRRPHPYVDGTGVGWPDNDLRFFAFSAAVAAIANETRPDVLHLNDWHTSAVFAFCDPAIPTVLSIHNLAYQGDTNEGWLERFGARAEVFARHGACNPLAGAIRLADAVVVVSPNYRAEILRPENAFGLHDVLAARADTIIGIRNGVETDVWDPASDPHIAKQFDATRLASKVVDRSALRVELGLREPEKSTSLAVVLSRLVDQKGIDTLVPLLRFLHRFPAQLAVLGAGDAGLVTALRSAAGHDPANVAFVEGYDEGFGHRLIAGGDLILMPSRFEPCGLTQMQAMRYGTIPVVSGVGGLVDTVIDADDHRSDGTGFVADDPGALAILDAWHRAHRAWTNPPRRAAIQRRGMLTDWSWRLPAERHVELYRSLSS